MVLYSEVPSEMYKQLHKLEQAAEGRGRKHKLQCHNFVNNADAVPRFLGGSLNTVHQALETYAPSMSVSRLGHMRFKLCNAVMKQIAVSTGILQSKVKGLLRLLLHQSAHDFEEQS